MLEQCSLEFPRQIFPHFRCAIVVGLEERCGVVLELTVSLVGFLFAERIVRPSTWGFVPGVATASCTRGLQDSRKWLLLLFFLFFSPLRLEPFVRANSGAFFVVLHVVLLLLPW